MYELYVEEDFGSGGANTSWANENGCDLEVRAIKLDGRREPWELFKSLFIILTSLIMSNWSSA